MKKMLIASFILAIVLVITYYYKDNFNVVKSENESRGNEMENTNINVTIKDKKYTAKIEDNETAQAFLNKLPQNYNMTELNGNEKYFYMDTKLPSNPRNPKHIEKGDIMLYGDDCLVVFYKSFDTSYSYTKIGHIDNLPDLGKDNIDIKFEK